MASSKVLKNRLVSNLLSRVAVPLRPAVASGVPIRRFSTIYDDKSASLTTNKTYPRSFKREDAENIYLYLDMPGIDKNDVEATVKYDGYLRDHARLYIKGEALEKDYECECKNYCDTFNLPENVETDGIKACMGNGVLKLTLPKTKEKISKTNKKFSIDQLMLYEITIKVDSTEKW